MPSTNNQGVEISSNGLITYQNQNYPMTAGEAAILQLRHAGWFGATLADQTIRMTRAAFAVAARASEAQLLRNGMRGSRLKDG